MPNALPNIIAIVSSLCFISMWFWEVRRNLFSRLSTLQSAKKQLRVSQDQYSSSIKDTSKKAVNVRCIDIYKQAAQGYNETLKKPWNYIPGILLGFKPEKISQL